MSAEAQEHTPMRLPRLHFALDGLPMASFAIMAMTGEGEHTRIALRACDNGRLVPDDAPLASLLSVAHWFALERAGRLGAGDGTPEEESHDDEVPVQPKDHGLAAALLVEGEAEPWRLMFGRDLDGKMFLDVSGIDALLDGAAVPVARFLTPAQREAAREALAAFNKG